MKIVIIGAGNGGVWTALNYAYHSRKAEEIEIELIHDPEIDSFPVGQALFPGQSALLYAACDISWYSNEVRATPKLGILYENWSKGTPNLYHEFPFDQIAMQADPKYLQRYILNSGLFVVKEGNVTDLDTVDADVIFDCRGNIGKDNIEYESLYSPVNSVLLAVGPPPEKPQLWSRHVATPNGWTFVIPNTTETLSYGYLYNSNITSIEEAKINFREVFPEAKGSYSQHFEHRDEIINLPFESYIAKNPIRIDSNGRKIILNGNRLAFLEPMESTAIGFYHAVAIFALDWIRGKDNVDAALVVANIKKMIHEIHTFTSWHYTKGSVYDTPFWRSAQVQTSAMFEQPDELFQNIVDLAKITDYVDVDITFKGRYGLWPAASIKRWYDGYINK
tara:strand:+ start:977 stop:2149 length:1173 start_codon:yes stop_codon:yes gene_type:complete